MAAKEKIRVLLVDDSPIALRILSKVLESVPDIIVVGTAQNGQEGLEAVKSLKPDVVCTDYHMPVMNGLEFTKRIMSENALPILVISVSVQDEGDEQNIFALLEAGAVDILPKPRGIFDPNYAYIKEKLAHKIRVLSGVRVVHRLSTLALPESNYHPGQLLRRVNGGDDCQGFINTRSCSRHTVVALGASTGGPQALQQILSALPPNFPWPILCIQHIAEGFLIGMVHWLQESCQLKIKIAEEGEVAQAGTVYMAPDRRQLTMDKNSVLHTADDFTEVRYLPSVDVTFSSLADHCGERVIAVLLTGMGDDGAAGLKKISEAGGITIVENEASCIVFGMPKVAIEMGAAQKILPLAEIASQLIAYGLRKQFNSIE